MSSTNPTTGSQNLIQTPASLTATLTSFLTVLVHQILYLRHLYPLTSFLSTRAYNYPVRQSRHPSVCAWINSAIAAVADQLSKGTVESISVIIFGVETNEVYERWCIALNDIPLLPSSSLGGSKESKKTSDLLPFSREDPSAPSGPDNPEITTSSSPSIVQINITDLEAQFRAVLSRLSSVSSRLSPLPISLPTSSNGSQKGTEGGEEISFTLSLEVRETADRPVGILEREERKWVAAAPEAWSDEQQADEDGDEMKKRKEQGRTLAVRRLEAGELRMEVWVEEGKGKFK